MVDFERDLPKYFIIGCVATLLLTILALLVLFALSLLGVIHINFLDPLGEINSFCNSAPEVCSLLNYNPFITVIGFIIFEYIMGHLVAIIGEAKGWWSF